MPTKSKSRTTSNRSTGMRPLVRRRLPTAIPPVHPGEMLLEESLKPLGISQSAFAIRLGVSFPRLNEIIRQKRGVTPDTALRFAQVTGMSADFGSACNWIGIFGTCSAPRARSALRSSLPFQGRARRDFFRSEASRAAVPKNTGPANRSRNATRSRSGATGFFPEHP